MGRWTGPSADTTYSNCQELWVPQIGAFAKNPSKSRI